MFFPFHKIPLQEDENTDSHLQISESYHGVYVSIIYRVSVKCNRGMMKRELKSDIEFIVEVPQEKKEEKRYPSRFPPSRLHNIDAKVLRSIPKFDIRAGSPRAL